MEITELVKTQLIQTYQNLVGDLVGSAPKIISGIILVLVAWLVAKIIERGVRLMMIRMNFDNVLGKIGIDTAIQQLGLRKSLSDVIPRVVYFLLLFLFARSLADTVGLTAISNAIGSFLGFVPNMIAAILILLVGSALGRFAGTAVARSAEESGLDFAPALKSRSESLSSRSIRIPCASCLITATASPRVRRIGTTASSNVVFPEPLKPQHARTGTPTFK